LHRTLAAAKDGRVIVLYAGSLVNLMEHGVGPAFDKATDNQFQGYATGSHRLANVIKGHLRQGDVFISANPKVNDSLVGAANGDWESWYITFAQCRSGDAHCGRRQRRAAKHKSNH
jgi:molybdate/tungstate transport system substrate-binding protein